MTLPDLKNLKKLADACRKAGIKHFKSGEMEFTLTDDVPEPKHKKRQVSNSLLNPSVDIAVEDKEDLTQQQLLFYSAIDPSEGIN